MRSPSCAAASEPQLYTVTDAAGLLTDEQNLQLEKQAAETAAKYGVGVYIVTVDDYRDVDEAGVYEATYGIYHTYTMGEGAERSGIMLLLSTTDRNFGLFRYGERAEYAFTAYGLKQLEKSFLPQFGHDDWYGGFTGFLKACDLYLAQAEAERSEQRITFWNQLNSSGPLRQDRFCQIVLLDGRILFVRETASVNAKNAPAS